MMLNLSKRIHWVWTLLVILALLGSYDFINQQTAATNAAATTITVPEAGDFATQKWGDAWDMSEFSDISNYFNGAGRHIVFNNFSVANGVFSSTSIGGVSGNMAFIFPLFPGYPGFMRIDKKLGSNTPMDPNAYPCLSIAMKVDSPTYVSGGSSPDGFRVMWYTDASLSPQGKAPNGGIVPVYLYPETVTQNPPPTVHNWRLYQVDLRNPAHGIIPGAASWTSAAWQGIEVDPTMYPNVTFSIDWIRMTTCNPSAAYQANVTWNPSSSVNTIWIRPSGTTRDIEVKTSITGSAGSYLLDTKGIAPGTYQVGLGTLSSCCTQWSPNQLVINPMPVINFVRPSPYSGEDYATSAANPWDIDPSDVKDISCTDSTFNNGLLQMNTANPAGLPSDCLGPEMHEADPKITLNLPAPLLTGGAYRYLSFRHYIDGAYALPADGMMMRWIWTATNNCTRVSADIPYDVGWHTYSIDLYNSFNGTPLSVAPSGCAYKTWSEFGQASQLRLDPNENWTGNIVPAQTFHQVLDWIRLTKVDTAVSGSSFPIRITANKSLSQLTSINFYYTTSPSTPTQHAALISKPGNSPAPTSPNRVYIPGVMYKYETGPSGIATYSWDTRGVAAGEYYICAVSNDGYNASTFCSDAPVDITGP